MNTTGTIKLVGMMIAAVLLAIGCSNGVPVLPGPGLLPPGNGVSPFKLTGGGWMNSACGSDHGKMKATFGFNLHFVPNETGTTIKGQFQYTDHGCRWTDGLTEYAKVSFHGVVADLDLLPFGMAYGGDYEGYYRPQPKTLGDGGTFLVSVEDQGQPGPSTSDKVRIEVVSGVFAGYVNEGYLKGGNIKLHEDEDED